MDIETLKAANAAQAEEILTLQQALTIRGQNADRDKLEIGQLKERLREIGSGEIMAQMARLEEALRITQLQLGGARMDAARVEAGGVRSEVDIRSAALEGAARIAETCYVKDAFRFELGTEAAGRIRAIKDTDTPPAKVQGSAVPEGISRDTAHQALAALGHAMTICDGVPTRAHQSEDSTLKYLGLMVNKADSGHHGYAMIRDALAALGAELSRTEAVATIEVPPLPTAAQVGSIGDDLEFRDLLLALNRAARADEARPDEATAQAIFEANDAIGSYIDQLLHQAAPGVLTAGWQPIESAPLDGREVLLAVKLRAGIQGKQLVGHYMPGGHCIEDHPPIASGWYFWNGCSFDKAATPTHWMPLPATESALAAKSGKEQPGGGV